MRFLKTVVIAAILVSSTVCNAAEGEDWGKFVFVPSFEWAKIAVNTPVSIIGIMSKNKAVLVNDLNREMKKLNLHREQLLEIQIVAADTGDTKTFVAKTADDIPEHSLRTDCPESDHFKNTKCYFIKYGDDEE